MTRLTLQFDDTISEIAALAAEQSQSTTKRTARFTERR